MRHDLHWLDLTDRIQFRIAVTVYRCLHGTAPEYLSELFVPASTRSSRQSHITSSDSNKLVVPPWLNCLDMDGVLLLHQAQLCGTASPNTSETLHYSLIRLGAILKHTFCSILIYTRRLSALETLWLHALYKFFYCDCVNIFALSLSRNGKNSVKNSCFCIVIRASQKNPLVCCYSNIQPSNKSSTFVDNFFSLSAAAR